MELYGLLVDAFSNEGLLSGHAAASYKYTSCHLACDQVNVSSDRSCSMTKAIMADRL